jgi:poly-gamma-glutamate synthesis protein (capsule biosynthesis protein)
VGSKRDIATQAAPRSGAVAGIGLVLALALMAVVSLHTVAADATDQTPASGSDARRPRPSAPVTMVFGGDVHFESWLADTVLVDPQGALTELEDLLADADLVVVNLETAVTDRGVAAPKQHTFRAPAEGLTALAAAGVDVVSVANNHGMDYGADGLADTLDAIDVSGMHAVGGGLTEQAANRPYRTEINGRRISVFGATQVLDTFALDAWNPGPERSGLASAKRSRGGLQRLLAAVRRAAADSDTVVAMLHWGRELEQCPLPRQRTLAAALRDAGVDIIVGGHAHRVGPGGYLGDTVVHYGLGNLVFYASDGPATVSGALAVTVDPDDATSITWRPAVLRGGVATALEGAERSAAANAWRALRSCGPLAARPGAG